MLTSLVTEGLHRQASSSMTESLRSVDSASLVLVACTVCELCMFYLGSTQHEHSIVVQWCAKSKSLGSLHSCVLMQSPAVATLAQHMLSSCTNEPGESCFWKLLSWDSILPTSQVSHWMTCCVFSWHQDFHQEAVLQFWRAENWIVCTWHCWCNWNLEPCQRYNFLWILFAREVFLIDVVVVARKSTNDLLDIQYKNQAGSLTSVCSFEESMLLIMKLEENCLQNDAWSIAACIKCWVASRDGRYHFFCIPVLQWANTAVFTNTGIHMEIMGSYVSYSNIQYRPTASYNARALVTHTHEILTGSKRV